MQAALGRARPWTRQLSLAQAEARPQLESGALPGGGGGPGKFLCPPPSHCNSLLGNFLLTVEETDAQRE